MGKVGCLGTGHKGVSSRSFLHRRSSQLMVSMAPQTAVAVIALLFLALPTMRFLVSGRDASGSCIGFLVLPR
jgi:hypothetical protein